MAYFFFLLCAIRYCSVEYNLNAVRLVCYVPRDVLWVRIFSSLCLFRSFLVLLGHSTVTNFSVTAATAEMKLAECVCAVLYSMFCLIWAAHEHLINMISLYAIRMTEQHCAAAENRNKTVCNVPNSVYSNRPSRRHSLLFDSTHREKFGWLPFNTFHRSQMVYDMA